MRPKPGSGIRLVRRLTLRERLRHALIPRIFKNGMDLRGAMLDKERAESLEQSSIDAASQGLKALLLLNGGACIAVLSFISSALSRETQANSLLNKGMMQSLVFFSLGAGLAVFTSFFAYLANQAYAAHLREARDSWKTGERWNLAGIACALLSLGCFFVGVGLIWCTART